MVKLRWIGEVEVFPIGLGAMPLSVPGRMPADRADAVRVVHAALDGGVTFIDTADAYAPSTSEFGHNERIVADALASWDGDSDAVLVATKGGHVRTGTRDWVLDGRPEHLRRACEASLRRLGLEAIGLYQHHRPDPAVPYAETMGALRDLADAGKIRMAGISNADPDQIRLARAVLGPRLAAVQNEFSPRFRSSAGEIDVCAGLGIAFLAWSPLGGIGQASDLGSAHAAFREVAAERGVSPQQVALAWELAHADAVVPIPGASRPSSIEDSLRAAHLQLTPTELSLLSGSSGSGSSGSTSSGSGSSGSTSSGSTSSGSGAPG